jgi:hypothetical protein
MMTTDRQKRHDAGPLGWEHLDDHQVNPRDMSGLGRLAECFEAMSEREDEAALGRWIAGAGVVAALLIGAVAWAVL